MALAYTTVRHIGSYLEVGSVEPHRQLVEEAVRQVHGDDVGVVAPHAAVC